MESPQTQETQEMSRWEVGLLLGASIYLSHKGNTQPGEESAETQKLPEGFRETAWWCNPGLEVGTYWFSWIGIVPIRRAKTSWEWEARVGET